MDSFDFFFPQQSQAVSLKALSKTILLNRMDRNRSNSETLDDVDELRRDVNFLTVVLAAILRRLAENETMSLADVADLVEEIDHLDGFADTGLEPSVLRGILGVIHKDYVPEPEEEDSIQIDCEPLWQQRYRRL